MNHPQTINASTSPVTGVLFACLGGKFLLRKDKDGFIDVVDNSGNVIGSAHLYSSGSGYAIHTAAYGGYASLAEVIFVNEENPTL